MAVEGIKYEYKATANGNWDDYVLPSGDNANFIFGTDEYPAGTYNLTFTADTENHTLTLDVQKKGEPVVVAHTWDFTKWSDATVANLKADAAQTRPATGWSDIEKAKDDVEGAVAPEATAGKCFWYNGGEAEPKADGIAIAELKGLEFNESYGKARSLAIAVNYPEATANKQNNVYHGAAYLWLGGSNKECFTIKNVKPGTTITMGVESHALNVERGVQLLANEEDLGEFKPTTYAENSWTVPEGEELVDVVVKNTNGCHIYFIDAEIGEQPEPLAPFDYEKIAIDPADHSTVESLQNFTLTFGGQEVTVNPEVKPTLGDALGEIALNEDGSVAVTFASAQTNPGNYTLDIPEGAILYGGTAIDPLSFTYTIAGAADFTIDPAEGEVASLSTFNVTFNNYMVELGDNAKAYLFNEETEAEIEADFYEIGGSKLYVSLSEEVKTPGEWQLNIEGVKKMDGTPVELIFAYTIKSTPTGITTVNADIANGTAVYNMNGQKVQKTQKGLYIVNGKKVMVK